MKIKFLIFICLFLILGGCGFKLRSQPDLSKQLGFIYLQEQTPPNALEHYLRNRLLLSGAKLTSNSKQAAVILQLAMPELKRTRLNSNVDIQTRLYTLTYSVQVKLATLGHKIEKPQLPKKFTTSHNIVVSADSTLDATGQLDTAIEEMQNEIVDKLLDYLRAEQFR